MGEYEELLAWACENPERPDSWGPLADWLIGRGDPRRVGARILFGGGGRVVGWRPDMVVLRVSPETNSPRHVWDGVPVWWWRHTNPGAEAGRITQRYPTWREAFGELLDASGRAFVLGHVPLPVLYAAGEPVPPEVPEGEAVRVQFEAAANDVIFNLWSKLGVQLPVGTNPTNLIPRLAKALANRRFVSPRRPDRREPWYTDPGMYKWDPATRDALDAMVWATPSGQVRPASEGDGE